MVIHVSVFRLLLPARASEQGNVIGLVSVHNLIYLKFVATDFFQKLLASVLAKIPVTQRSPCYSAVSTLLTNPLPDHYIYSPLLPHPLPHSGSIFH